jgi:hypothetical protein
MSSAIKKTIADIPDVKAEKIGLRKVSNGYVAWLEDSEGNEYRAPHWLLNLLHTEKEIGYNDAINTFRRFIGLE